MRNRIKNSLIKLTFIKAVSGKTIAIKTLKPWSYHNPEVERIFHRLYLKSSKYFNNTLLCHWILLLLSQFHHFFSFRMVPFCVRITTLPTLIEPQCSCSWHSAFPCNWHHYCSHNGWVSVMNTHYPGQVDMLHCLIPDIYLNYFLVFVNPFPTRTG